jgi:hypothetical protein
MPETYFTVALTEPGAEAALRAYLYSHTDIMAAHTDETTGSTIFLCSTEADTEDRAMYLGKYQADRLASGMHFTSPVDPNPAVVNVYTQERWGFSFTTYDVDDYAGRYCEECHAKPGEPCDPSCTAKVSKDNEAEDAAAAVYGEMERIVEASHHRVSWRLVGQRTVRSAYLATVGLPTNAEVIAWAVTSWGVEGASVVVLSGTVETAPDELALHQSGDI